MASKNKAINGLRECTKREMIENGRLLLLLRVCCTDLHLVRQLKAVCGLNDAIGTPNSIHS
jgi:hypothetical protein